MATVMLMEWPGVTTEQYNSVMGMLGLDAKLPVGALFHVAGFAGTHNIYVPKMDAIRKTGASSLP
jgi:hypothetical protein